MPQDITVKIYGADDDLIEVDEIASNHKSVTWSKIADEFPGPGFIELSTGDIFEVLMNDNGCWNVQHIEYSGLVQVDIFYKDEEDDDGYTGHAVVTGPIQWADYWESWPMAESEMVRRVQEQGDLSRLKGSLLREVYNCCVRKR
ncbi:hypothetical protein HC928_02315 [bacterium]|nr:hypothetical protein [bacterium]